MKIMSFNVREWTRDKDKSSPYYWETRLDSICRCIREENPDILCLQECWPRFVKAIKKIGYKSVGFSFHHLILIKKRRSACNHHYRIFYDWCEVGDTRIINVHSRWEDKIINHVIKKVSKLAAGRKAIACGDFNTTYVRLCELGFGMIHARSELWLDREDTFENFKHKDCHGEIDHFFVNCIKPKSFKVIKENYGCERMSDHYPICLTF